MEKLFYRVEHTKYYDDHLTRNYVKNLINENNPSSKHDFKKKIIFKGPWGVCGIYSDEESEYIASVSCKHPLPYLKKDRYFDKEINDIVMGPCGPHDNLIKENFIFGCASLQHFNQYFPPMFKEILARHDFRLGIYCSQYVFSSKYQSVLDISKPFSYIGSMKIN